jgi:hypothetical protein
VILVTAGVESGYMAVESGYMAVESGYILVESGYMVVESGYMVVESGYMAVESGYMAVESGYMAVESGVCTKNSGHLVYLYIDAPKKRVDGILSSFCQTMTRPSGQSSSSICSPVLQATDCEKRNLL